MASASLQDRACGCPGGQDAAGQESAFQRAFAVAATPAETGRFAYAVEPADRLAAAIEYPALQVCAQAAQALAGGQLHPDGDKGAGPGFLQWRGFTGAQPVRAPLPGMADHAYLGVVV